MGAEATPSEISRNSQKFEKQFSLISSYFSELNTSVPTSTSVDREIVLILGSTGYLRLSLLNRGHRRTKCFFN